MAGLSRPEIAERFHRRGAREGALRLWPNLSSRGLRLEVVEMKVLLRWVGPVPKKNWIWLVKQGSPLVRAWPKAPLSKSIPWT